MEQFQKISSCFQNQQFDEQLQSDQISLQHGNTHCNLQNGHPDIIFEQFAVKRTSNIPQHKVQQFNCQQPPIINLTNSPLLQMMKKSSLQLNILVSRLQKLLDKDRSLQLQALYNKLLNYEISKENFLKVCRNIVGDRMIREAAIHQLQLQVQGQAVQQSNQKNFLFGDSADMRGLHAAQQSAANGSEINGEGAFSNVCWNAVNNTQQQIPAVRALDPLYNGYSFEPHANSLSSIGTTSTSLELQNQKSQMWKSVINSSIDFSEVVSSTQPMRISAHQNYEQQKAVNVHTKIHGVSTSQMVSQYQRQVAWQHASSSITSKEPNCVSIAMDCVGKNSAKLYSDSLKKVQFPVPQSSFTSVCEDTKSVTLKGILHENLCSSWDPIKSSDVGAVPGLKTDVANSIMQPLQSQCLSLSGIQTGHKRALESSSPRNSPPPPCSKKQKASGTLINESIEQLNDVAVISGVNLQAEEEQLLCAQKDGMPTQASEVVQRAVEMEDKRTILQKGPLQKKLEQIIYSCGLGGISDDVERCLSMCAEERLRRLITNLIRLSKQRVDIEKRRHQVAVTSDVGFQIWSMKRKAKEEFDKKQADESVKLQKSSDNSTDVGASKDKDDRQASKKAEKYCREEDDKMRATAANAVARAAVGVDDMLTKWQLMAEQARQQREGKPGDAHSRCQQGSSSSEGKQPKPTYYQNQLAATAGGKGRNGKSTGMYAIDRRVCMKDVIASLEKEPLMSKSTLLYRLYERSSTKY